MAIDKSGTRWVGSEAADIEEYLRAVTAENYPADRFVHATCTCGGAQFHLDADSNEGCTQRTCTRCKQSHLVCDSGEYRDDAEPEGLVCPCGANAFEVAVGFSHSDDGSVKWITVGMRCVTCGVLGSSADWKIDYGPTDQLYAQV